MFGDPVHAVWVVTDHVEDGADFSGWWFGDQVGGTQAHRGVEYQVNGMPAVLGGNKIVSHPWGDG